MRKTVISLSLPLLILTSVEILNAASLAGAKSAGYRRRCRQVAGFERIGAHTKTQPTKS
jgi:hypothetical protein